MSIINIKTTNDIPNYSEISKIINNAELVNSYINKFCQLSFEIEFKDIHTRYINALQRIMCDELIVPRLTCSIVDADFNIKNLSPTMTYNYVIKRIQAIPLVYPFNKKWLSLKFEINVTNTTSENLTITAADLKIVDKKIKYNADEDKINARQNNIDNINIFNKSTIIAVIQPGTSLVIKNIYITENSAINDGKFTGVCNTGIRWNMPSEYSLYKNDYNINPFNFDESNVKSLYLCGTLPCVSCETAEDPIKSKELVKLVLTECCENFMARLNQFNLKPSNEFHLSDETNTIVSLLSFEFSKLNINFNWYEINRKFVFENELNIMEIIKKIYSEFDSIKNLTL